LAIDVVKSDEWQETTTLTKSQVIHLLEFIPGNSYFTYHGMHYHQVFGCPMGLPVSAVVADLVMDNIVERALSTSPTAPR